MNKELEELKERISTVFPDDEDMAARTSILLETAYHIGKTEAFARALELINGKPS